MNKYDLDSILSSYEEKLPESIQKMANETLANLPDHPFRQRNGFLRKKALFKIGIAMIVSLGLLISGMQISPTFAEWMESVFSSGDAGLKQVSQAGLTKREEIVIEDQGISIVITEIFADKSRVTFSYYIKDKNGAVIDPTYVKIPGKKEGLVAGAINNSFLRDPITKKHPITLTDEKGRKIKTDLDTPEPPKNEVVKDKQGRSYILRTLEILDQNVPKNLQLHFNLTELNLEGGRRIAGNWNKTIPLTIKPGKQIVANQNEFTTPDGSKLLLDRLELSPSSSQVFLKIKKTEKLSYIFPKEFQITDGQGNIVGVYAEDKEGKNFIDYNRSPNDSQQWNFPAETLHTYSFTPFTKSNKYTFHLKRLAYAQRFHQPLHIPNPQKPTTFNINGDQLTIKDFKFDGSGVAGTKFTVEYLSKEKIEHVSVSLKGDDNFKDTNGFENYRLERLKNGMYSLKLDIKIQGTNLDLSKPIDLELREVQREMKVNWSSEIKVK